MGKMHNSVLHKVKKSLGQKYLAWNQLKVGYIFTIFAIKLIKSTQISIEINLYAIKKYINCAVLINPIRTWQFIHIFGL
jgi:hypothetical protein